MNTHCGYFNIPQKLLIQKSRGIIFEGFYREVIYPFFTTFHYKESTGEYTSGEYQHHFEIIAQFYKEGCSLKNFKDIVVLQDTVIGGIMHQSILKVRYVDSINTKNVTEKKFIA